MLTPDASAQTSVHYTTAYTTSEITCCVKGSAPRPVRKRPLTALSVAPHRRFGRQVRRYLLNQSSVRCQASLAAASS